MTLLSSRFELFDIDDVERFASRIVERSRLELSYHDREDLLASLIFECWRCANDYDPSRAAFSTFATYKLRAAVVTWLRTSNERCGRTGFVGGRTIWKYKNKPDHVRPQRILISFDDDARLVDTLAGGTAIARQIGTRLLEGYTPGEIGKELGISRCSVSSLVDELRSEIERLS